MISTSALVRSVLSLANAEVKLLIALVLELTLAFVSVNLVLVSALYSFIVVVNAARFALVLIKPSDTEVAVELASFANSLDSFASSSACSAFPLISFSASVALSLSVITLSLTSAIFSA